MRAELLPEEIKELYDLKYFVHNSNIIMYIHKGTCGLNEAGALAYEDLKQNLVNDAPQVCRSMQLLNDIYPSCRRRWRKSLHKKVQMA